MHRALAVVLLFSSFACAQVAVQDATSADAAMKAIRPEALRAHMHFLADALLQGRAPGTSGYDIAAAYVATQMESMGLKPAGSGGGWFQPVPLRKYRVVPEQTSVELVRRGKTETLAFGKDYVLGGDAIRADSALEAPVVFVGYGVSAPELNYDDYAGLDVKGKVIVMLRGAPASFPSVQRAYFSDGVNKSRNAVARGVLGILNVMTPEDQKRARWDWIVPQVQSGGMRWLEADGTPHDTFPQMRGVALLSQRGADLLFAGAPKSLEQEFAGAREGHLDHFALPVTIKMHLVSTHAQIQSANIVGVLPGSDPKLRDEYVVYTAHVDHLGICPPVNGDNVCHGALDNASGVAALLEIARAFTALPQPPRRSILFAFVTGEEKGLLGSDYFANHPTVAPEAMVANINIDGAPGMMYPFKDIVALGVDDSSLAHNVADVAKRMGLEVSPDPMPEEVFFIRSDNYSLVRRGVPAVSLSEGFKSTDPKLNGEEIIKKWMVTVYHTPKDNMNQPLLFESGVKGTQLNFLVGYEVAQQAERPAWNPGDFFGAKFAGAAK